jgi:hypothetical protein
VSEHALLPPPVQALALAVLLLVLAWVVRLIRAQRLSVRDSLTWLLTTVAALVVTAFPQLLSAGARLVGVQVPSNALFAAGLVYLAVNLLSVTIATSASAERTRRLAQECALLRAELERLRQSGRAGGGGGGEPPAP